MAKVAFITGATRGIGKQIAIEFAKDGYDIAFNYRKENEDLGNIKKQIKELNVRCLPVKGDVSIFDDTVNMVNQIINEFGKIDVLVNNVTKNVIPYMIKQRSGRIINISSVVGVSGNAGQTNYSASKAGIIGFTKSLAKEVASRNILVNAVAPGFIETQMTDVLKQEVKEEIAKNIPLRRMGTPEDVANVVKFLAGEQSSYITGQVINVDGGMLM